MEEQKLHILTISSWYPTENKPFLGNFIKRHVDLISSKHFVTVLNLQSGKDISSTTIQKKTNGNLTEIFVEYPDSRNPFAKLFRAKKAFKKAVREIDKIDLIHGHIILSKGLQFIWAKKHFKKPLVVTEQASYYGNEISKNWSLKDKMIVNQVMKHADCVTAVSPFLKDEIEKLFPGKSVEVFPNVIDTRIFSKVEKHPNLIPKFVHISTLDERFKNVSGMIKAAHLLKSEMGSRFNLKIISDESYQKWEDKVREMKLEDCVSFAGPMQMPEIANELSQADAMILFSNYETFSCVIAESWATGTPVISTPVGIAKSLNPAFGIQVDVNDIEGLKNAMKQFAEGNVNFEYDKIRKKSEEYFPGKVLEMIERIYEKVLQ